MQKKIFFLKELGDTDKVSNDGNLKSWKSFITNEGLLKIGRRLSNSNLNFGRKFPILQPSKHKLTHIIVQHYHEKYLYAGPNSLLNYARQKFWIPDGRNKCTQMVQKCVKCFKGKPLTMV